MHRVAMTDPDLNLLVALRALLEEENVTRAGERIGMGQSTMSSALSRLRAVFEDELLVRIGRDYELTPLARQILPQVQVTLPLVVQALGKERPFHAASDTRRFTLQITDFAAIELRPVFALAAAAGPGISFDLRRLPTDPTEANRDLLANDYIVAVPGIGIEAPSIEISRDEYVVVADRNNPVVADGTISLDDFLTSQHVRCDFGRAHITPAERRMRELDLRPAVRVTTSTLLSMPLIISGTDLVGVVPRKLVERASGSTTVVTVPTPFPTVDLIHRLWWHQSHAHDPAHAWFRQTVEQVVGAKASEA